MLKTMQFSTNIEEIKENFKIENIVSDYVQLKRAGNILKGLCPFHNENTPSFVVSPIRQNFKCFGCGESGDVISFIQKIDNLNFVDAVKKLNGDFSINKDWRKSEAYKTVYVAPEPKQISFIEFDIFNKSLNDYGNNDFVIFLKNKFGSEITNDLIAKYHIGTSKRFKNGVVFWQIDADGGVRTGKIMQYDALTLLRVQEPTTCIDWVHSKMNNFKLCQCFFGEHLLAVDKTKTIAIAESEKSAIVGAAFYPDYIWLAAGNKDALKSKISVLRNRNIILYPDAQAYNDWKEIADDWQGINNITVSSLIEKNATDEEYNSKVDLADYLLRYSI